MSCGAREPKAGSADILAGTSEFGQQTFQKASEFEHLSVSGREVEVRRNKLN
jgi:hypothetical protein